MCLCTRGNLCLLFKFNSMLVSELNTHTQSEGATHMHRNFNEEAIQMADEHIKYTQQY